MSVELEFVRDVLAALPHARAERVPLAAANGRYLACDVVADRDYWPFDRAAMDGIAIRAHDVREARPDRPVDLTVSGSIYCGDGIAEAPLPGSAMRIATGAPLPRGADTVVPQELVVFHNGTASVGRPIVRGKNVFGRAEDMRAGDLVLAAGARLRGAQLAALAALGWGEVPVTRRIRVAVVPCGDELAEPGEAVSGGRIPESNSFMLGAELEDLGAAAERAGIVPDDPAAVRAAIADALTADAIVTCGGLSVGERDYVRVALRALDARFVFEGAPIAPGHPVAMAFLNGVPVFALPGTPGACRVAFEAVVRPAILAMLGASVLGRPRLWARLTARLDVRPGRTRFIWARSGAAAGGLTVSPLADQGTAAIRSPSDADALIVLPPGTAVVEAGLAVETWLLAEPPTAARPEAPRAALAVVGARNAGKTTLIERLIPLFAARGVRVAALKRHGHMDSLDDPAKDTGRMAAAGATLTLLTGELGSIERRPKREATLEDALASLRGVDLVLVEGYADGALAKIRVVRDGFGTDRPAAAPPFAATVGDVPPVAAEAGVTPAFGWDRLEALVDYLLSRYLS